MSQPSIKQFFEKASNKHSPRNPPIVRTYSEICSELVKEADRLFQNSLKKQKFNKDDSQENTDNSAKKNLRMSYKSYTVEQKEIVVKLRTENQMSYVAIQDKYGIDAATSRFWVKNGITTDKRSANGKRPVLECLESDLKTIIVQKREKGIPIDSNLILSEFTKLYKAKYNLNDDQFSKLQQWCKFCASKDLKVDYILSIKSTEKVLSFNAQNQEIELPETEKTELRDLIIHVGSKIILLDNNWVHRFAERNNLTFRKLTHQSSKTPTELEWDILKFLEEVGNLRKDYQIPPELIINMDETAIFYDQIPTHSYELRGRLHPHIKTTNFSKKQLTSALAISASGEKLKPILIFHGTGKKTTVSRVKNYAACTLVKNENAWMTSKIFKKFLQENLDMFLFKQRKRCGLENSKGLLLLDNFSAHLLEVEDKNKIEKDLNIIIKYLKPYTTPFVQPLDLSINYLLKSKMRQQWLKWFDNENLNEKAPKKQLIYDWFNIAWEAISPVNIVKAFLSSGVSNNLDDSQDLFSKNLLKLKNETLEQCLFRIHQTKLSDDEQRDEKYFKNPYDAIEEDINTKDEEILVDKDQKNI